MYASAYAMVPQVLTLGIKIGKRAQMIRMLTARAPAESRIGFVRAVSSQSAMLSQSRQVAGPREREIVS